MKTVPFPKRRRPLKEYLLGEAAATLLRLLGLTWRFDRHDGISSSVLNTTKPFIFAFWHGQQLILPIAYAQFKKRKSRKGIFTLISAHSDGRIIARAIKHFGLDSVKGSSTRRGGQALLELIRKAEDGYDIAFTPDGPKGPAEQAKIGVIEAARKSGVSIIPIACSANKSWHARSWDSMIIPKPGARLKCILGAEMIIPKDATDESLSQYAETLSKNLTALTKEANAFE